MVIITVGISWTPENRKHLEEERPINLENCEIPLEFTFESTKSSPPQYPRKEGEKKFADFGILNIPSIEFQTETLSMNFETVDFNWYSSPHTDKVTTTHLCPILLSTYYWFCFYRICNLPVLWKHEFLIYTNHHG